MSKDLDISKFEQGLREQFNSAEVPAPDSVWNELESNLDSMQSDMQFDQSMREGLQNANITPPSQIWQAVQQGMGWANGGGFWAGLAGKWIIGVGSAAIISSSAYLLINNAEDKVQKESVVEVDQTPNVEINSSTETEASELPTNLESEEATTSSMNQVSSSNGSTERVEKANSPESNNAQGSRSPGFKKPETPSSPSGERSLNNSSSGNNTGKEGNTGNQSQFNFGFALSLTSHDTILCDGTSYQLRILDNRFDKVVVYDGETILTTLKSGSVIDLGSLSTGVHNLSFKAYGSEGYKPVFQTVQVVPAPKAELQVQEWEGGKYVFILDTREALKFSWFLDGLFKQESRVWEHKFVDTKAKQHAICAVFKNDQGCTDSITKTFTNESVITLLEPEKSDFFTPNNDGYGDLFKLDVAGQTYWHMSILDKNNRTVFETFDAEKGWNGVNQFNGQECDKGQYICVLEYQMTGGERKKLTWLITLSR